MKKIKTHLIASSVIANIAAFAVLVTLAAVTLFAHEALAAPVSLDNPIGEKNIPILVNRAIKAVLGITGAAALVMFLYGGVLWMTAMGEEKRIKQGWDTMTWAALGMAAIFLSYAIVRLILRAVCGATGAGDPSC